jgi:hypothetical protein
MSNDEVLQEILKELQDQKRLLNVLVETFIPDFDQADESSREPSFSEEPEEANQPLPSSHNEQGRQRSLFDQPSSDEVDEDAF